MCDATIVDTFAPSYTSPISGGPGSVVTNAEYRKKMKYSTIMESHFFVPIGIETTGAFGKDANTFFLDLGNRFKLETEDLRSSLLQRLAVAVQHGAIQQLFWAPVLVRMTIILSILLLLIQFIYYLFIITYFIYSIKFFLFSVFDASISH